MTSPADKKIVVLPGDGIGVEVIAEAVRVIDWFRTRRGLAISIEHQAYGADAYRRYGSVLPPATEAALSTADAILFGATGGPEFDEIPLAARRQGSLLHIRRSLQLYANLRPIVTIPALYDASSLKNRVLQGVDFIIVRELIGGIYFGEPRGIETLPNGERRGVNTQVYTTSEIRRVARFAGAYFPRNPLDSVPKITPRILAVSATLLDDEPNNRTTSWLCCANVGLSRSLIAVFELPETSASIHPSASR